MKKRLCSTLMIAATCITLAGCGGSSSDEGSGLVFEPQPEASVAQESKQDAGESGDSQQNADEKNADEQDASDHDADDQGNEQNAEGQKTSDKENKQDSEGQNTGGQDNTQNADKNDTNDQNSGEQNDNSGDSKPSSTASGVSICDETTELDYSNDYAEEIKVAVERAVAESTSFEDEFNRMGLIQDHIISRRSEDQNQAEMNMAAFYYFEVWDAELNNLWNRFSESANAETKEKVLADQRHWNAMKQDAAIAALGPQDEGGSIYPSLYDSFMEEATKARCYFLAKEMSAAKGDSFPMPNRAIMGTYIDNQGTDSIYSSLSITEGWESGYVAKISLYRTGELTGSVTESGIEELEFVSDDESVKGTIKYGWDGATFEVTEAGDDAIVSVGDSFDFPFVF